MVVVSVAVVFELDVVVSGNSLGNFDFLGSYIVCEINVMTVPSIICDTDTVVGPNN